MRSRKEILKRRDEYRYKADVAKVQGNAPLFVVYDSIAKELDWASGNVSIGIDPQKIDLTTK